MDHVLVDPKKGCRDTRVTELESVQCHCSSSNREGNEGRESLREKIQAFLKTERQLLEYHTAFRTNHAYYLIERSRRLPGVP